MFPGTDIHFNSPEPLSHAAVHSAYEADINVRSTSQTTFASLREKKDFH